MNVWATQQTAETISRRYAEQAMLDANPEYAAAKQARLQADTADYYRERRLKAVKRYLRERASRAK